MLGDSSASAQLSDMKGGTGRLGQHSPPRAGSQPSKEAGHREVAVF